MTDDTHDRAQAAERPAQPCAIRLLAAEDNVVHQLVLKTLLHHVGVDLTLVENGRRVVEAWKTGEWDVILMDFTMPEMDGPTATRMIRSLEAKSGRARTTIIAVSAEVTDQKIAECLAAGMDAHVAKPIAADGLYRAIKAALDATCAQASSPTVSDRALAN